MSSPLPTPGAAQPIVGAPRDASCRKTIAVIKNKLAGLSRLRGRRMLDVGCGDGSFTLPVGEHFQEVHGIDVQEDWLAQFQRRVTGDPRFTVTAMSASAMAYPDAHFDTLVTIETIEHIADLPRAAAEMFRVLRPGGELLLTCPNRWFPFENHGIRIGGREYSRRIPLLPYLPPLHDRFSLARVFTVRALDRIFGGAGFRRARVDYAWPTFEHGGNRLQPLLRPLFGWMRWMERSPLRMFGSSIVARYDKPSTL